MYGEDDDKPGWLTRFFQKPTSEQMMGCVEQQNLKALNQLIAKDRLAVNEGFGATGWTPFLAACQKGWRDGVVAMLPRADVHKSVEGLYSETPMVILARHGFALLNEVLATKEAQRVFQIHQVFIREALPHDSDRLLLEVWEQTQCQPTATATSHSSRRMTF